MDLTHDLNHRFEADSVGRTLGLLGEKWTLLILRESFYGATRFEQFHTVLNCPRNLGIPRPTLTVRLRRLVDAGLLERVRYTSDPDRFEYNLTEAGIDLFPSIVALMRWGDAYLSGPQGPPIALRHNDCGEIADPFLACSHCGGAIDARNVTAERGPGFVEAGTGQKR